MRQTHVGTLCSLDQFKGWVASSELKTLLIAATPSQRFLLTMHMQSSGSLLTLGQGETILRPWVFSDLKACVRQGIRLTGQNKFHLVQLEALKNPDEIGKYLAGIFSREPEGTLG